MVRFPTLHLSNIVRDIVEPAVSVLHFAGAHRFVAIFATRSQAARAFALNDVLAVPAVNHGD